VLVTVYKFMHLVNVLRHYGMQRKTLHCLSRCVDPPVCFFNLVQNNCLEEFMFKVSLLHHTLLANNHEYKLASHCQQTRTWSMLNVLKAHQSLPFETQLQCCHLKNETAETTGKWLRKFKDFNDQAFLSAIKGRVYGDKKYEIFLSDWPLYKNKSNKTTLDSLIINFFKFYVLLP